MKKIIAIVIIIAIIAFIIFRKGLTKPAMLTPAPSVEQTLNLPPSWKQIETSNVAFKLEKTVNQGIKPQITVVKSQSKEALTPKSYVEKLIAGAASAIPSLKLNSQKTSLDNGVYSALISGYYYNQKNKISLIQRILIKNETLYTLTASFADNESVEINQILDILVKEKVLF